MIRLRVTALALILAAPVLADDPVAKPESFELTGERAADEVWKVRVSFDQTAQGVEMHAELTESWRVTRREGGGATIAMTLTGVSMQATAPGETEDRSYGEDQIGRILDREGNAIPFARTWTVTVDDDWAPQGSVDGLGDTIRQLVDYAGHRLEADGALPSWVDQIPAELRMAVRQFAAEVATETAVEIHDEIAKALARPYSTAVARLRTGAIEPGTEISIGADAGNATYRGTIDEGRQALFEFEVAGAEAQGVDQGASFSIDRQGRPRSLAVEQRVSAAMTGMPGEVAQSVRFEVVEIGAP